ncbi:CDP-alcohol phosphatidyltransferase family protein [Haloechinothrix sp. YIM 98757]|uniref:CDP-alcohol phosphatidyltransferase family protein n=2 Tax=Haloechinothrix aidingensis TaxID=2752311 RepID=A0A838A954_9PSEU|nr:CDP-alcohol phosphatidyltransferase family protein [Haloechinothrix aidingensis]
MLLALLPAGRWRARAWSDFLAMAARRSIRQAVARPRAIAEVTALHGLVIALGRDRRLPVWSLVSWALAAGHLGLLEHRQALGAADMLSLARANLPAMAPAGGVWQAAAALGSDLLDGRIARATGTVSPFGRYADSFADAAFWIWFTVRNEPAPRFRAAAVAVWLVPVLAVTATSVAHGRMVDAPRPRLVRPAALAQAALTVRALRRG